MTPNPVTLPSTATVAEAAQRMRDEGIGDVLVQTDGSPCILTDRDIAVRAVAEGKDPTKTPIADICTSDVVTVTPDTSVEEAAKLMRERAVRRLPVLDGDELVGMVSIGDLAVEHDQDSALADISAAPPNN